MVVDEAKIVQLPLNGRNFTQLGTLIPGVVEPPARLGGARGDADAAIHGFGAATAGFAVNGVRNQSNNFLLDGAANNDTFNTGFVVRPPPDAIEEFKILTHSYTAEFGRNAGSIVNVVTKSGGNSLQGSIWEFNRDDSLESRNYFSPPDQEKPTLAQDQFGGTIGGPLVTDRLFGFGYYEGFRNTRGTTQNIAVMSAAERMGDFSGSGTIIDPMTGEPFPGNVIPADRLSSIATRLIDEFMPLPNVGGRYIASPDVTDDRDQFGLRLDFRIADSQNVLVRALRSASDRFEPPTVRPIGNTAASTLEDYMVSHTATVGSNVFNQVRVMSSAIDAEPVVTSGLTNSEYGINLPNINDLAIGLPQFSISGFPSMGDRNQPFVKRENEVEQFTEDLTILRGRHTIKAGIDYRNEKMFIGFINRPNGDFVFRGTHTGSAAADFLLGMPSLFRTAVPGADSINEGDGSLYAGYIQDEFRLSPRLTLNLGLRYELAEPFEDTGDALNSFRPGEQSTRFPDAPTGLVYPGDAGVPAGTYDTDSNNFAPRLAMVWDPEGDGRSSLRLGWGLFHDSLPGQGDFFQNSVLAPPFNPLVQLNAPPTVMTLADPLANLTGGPTRFPPGIIFIGWGSEFTTPNYQHYNLTYQRQLGQSIGLEVGWVGSRGRNLPIFMEVNPRVVEPGQTTLGPRLYPAFSLVRPTFTVAKSWYDAFQASIRMRPTHGLNFLFSYTYGEAEDHVSGLNIGGEERPIVPVDLERLSFHRQGARARARPGAVRRRASPRAQLRLRPAVARRAERVRSRGVRQLAVERHPAVPDGLSVPDPGPRRRHSRPDVAPGPGLQPEQRRAEVGGEVVQHGVLRATVAGRDRRAARQRGPQPDSGSGLRTDRPVADQARSARRRRPVAPAPRRGVQRLRPGQLRPAGEPDRRPQLRGHHGDERRRPDRAARNQVQLLASGRFLLGRQRASGGRVPADAHPRFVNCGRRGRGFSLLRLPLADARTRGCASRRGCRSSGPG